MRVRLRGTFLLLLALVLRPGAVLGLTLLKIQVPPVRMTGEHATLVCEYRLEDAEKLYSVKWYKDNEEFYRYVPKSKPVNHSYKVEGIKVEHKHSDSKQVYLSKLNLKSRGNYRCEVTAEAPSFTSVHSEAHMEVIYYNKENPNPTIAGGEQTYEVGDVINLNCTSSQSYPAAELKWYINGNQVSGDAVIKYEQLETKQGFVRSNSGLRFVVEPQHVLGGRMTVRCTATVSANFWQTESQQSMLPQPGYWEKQLLVRGGAARNPSASVVMTLLLTSLATLAASALLWGDGGWT